MSAYEKWNKALIQHYFPEENKNKEIILYADKELISDLGKVNKLGDYDDFLKVILLDFNGKYKLYNSLFFKSGRVKIDDVPYNRGDVFLNKALKKQIIDFPNLIFNSNEGKHLFFFSYIIFYITIYVGNDKTSFYQFLNSKIQEFLPNENQRITRLKDLDVLFDELEKWSLEKNNGTFRSRRIGKLSYLGLLNYQVILKPNEVNQFEELLYKYQIELDDNAIYPEFVNKLLPYIVKGGLRNKLIKAINDNVYAQWFLNKAHNFNFSEYANSEKGKNTTIHRKAKLAYKINTNFELCLVTDLMPNDDEKIMGFELQQSGKDNSGYYTASLSGEESIKFIQRTLFTSNKLTEFNTVIINDINFFYKSEGNYIQTLHPPKNYDLLILVKNNKKSISAWEKWAAVETNINLISKSNAQVLVDMFREEYVFYTAKNIKKSFYKNKTDDIVYTTTFKDDLTVKKLGGIKVGTNIYLDIGLPFFQVLGENFIEENYSFKVLRNGIQDKDIKHFCEGSKIYFYLNKEITLNEASLVIVKITNNRKNIEKSFDFQIMGTKLKTPEKENLFEFNSWGDTNFNSKKFIKGNSFIGSNKVLLGGSKHVLPNLKKQTTFEANYFIYVLTALFYNSKKDHINKLKINSAIDSAISYLKSKDYQVIESKYSRYILIKNLIALGYINYNIDNEGNQYYQLMPPGIKKIEKSFRNNGNQIYQTTGARTKFMKQKLEYFCEENSITIRYMHSTNRHEIGRLEDLLLPEIIYLDLSGKVDVYKQFIKDNFEIDLYFEDQIHLGDTLLNFTASIDLFDQKYLQKEVSLTNHPLKSTDKVDFPRIRTSVAERRFRGQDYDHDFLENTLGKFFKIESKSWTNLYIAKQQKKTIAIMGRVWDGKSYNYKPEVLIPSKIKLPNLIYTAFCQINHGIPKTKKVFLKNVKPEFLADSKSFLYFDQYKLSDKEGRRERMVEVLTGTKVLENNEQIEYFLPSKPGYSMKFIKGSLDSDRTSSIIVENNNRLAAVITSYKEVFVNKEYLQETDNEVNIMLEDKSYSMLQVLKKGENLNAIMSKILDANFEFEFSVPNKKQINITSEYSENIIIKELL